LRLRASVQPAGGGFAVGVSASARGRRGRVAGSLLLGYAAFSAAGGLLFFMDQRQVLEAGEGARARDARTGDPRPVSLFLVGAMAFAATLVGRWFRYDTYATIVILVVCGLLTSLYIPRFDIGEPTPWVGITERINIYATMLWMAVLAIGLLRAPARNLERRESARRH